MTISSQDICYMEAALDQARLAVSADEVPVGAVVVHDDEIIGRGYNQPRAMADPTAHAEIVALRAACTHANNYRLPGATVYVTLEPCLMCIGSLLHARIYRLVYGAAEPKTGAVESTFRALDDLPHNHAMKVSMGVMEIECKGLVQSFFRARR